jgi:tRNA(Ile)-lysidine synthase
MIRKKSSDLIFYKFEKNLNNFLKTNPEIKTIFVAFSGGPDSTSLLFLLKKYKEENKKNFELKALHIQHNWESIFDNYSKNTFKQEKACVNFCKKNKLEILIEKLNLQNFKTNKKHESLESFCHKLRKDLYEKKLQENKNSIIAIGHTKDDQIETFFIRLFRGSSLDGLSCMSTFKNNLFRPLLNFNKIELKTYLQSKKIKYYNDPMNKCEDFLRVKIRKKICPTVKKIEDRAENCTLKNIENINDANVALNFCLEKLIENNVFFKDKTIEVNKKFLENLPNYLKKMLLNKVLFFLKVDPLKIKKSFFEEIERFINNKKSLKHSLEKLKISKNKNIIIFFIA